jgi:hypothetical protein
MKVHRGKTHKYLGMSLDFSYMWQCQVTMHDYICEDLLLIARHSALQERNAKDPVIRSFDD